MPPVVSFGSGTGVPPVDGHGQDGRATANDTTTRVTKGLSSVPITDSQRCVLAVFLNLESAFSNSLIPNHEFLTPSS